MKIAVIGKGGSGKTTTSSVLARSLARRGRPVVALDCDSNANLGISLGIGYEDTSQLVSMRERLDEGSEEHAPGPQEMLDMFGLDAPDGVQFAVITQIDNIKPGCPCCGLSPDQLLGAFDAPDRFVIADMEAGIGTLTRVEVGAIDRVVLVAEPTTKSLDVAERAIGLAREKGIHHITVVASKVVDDADLEAVRSRFPDVEVVAVPEDPAIMAADRDGVSPMDASPDSAAVAALGQLVDLLDQPLAAAAPTAGLPTVN